MTDPVATPVEPPAEAPVPRPNPLGKVAGIATAVWGAAAAGVSLAVQFGVLTAAQGAAISDLGNALPGWILAVGALVAVVLPFLAAAGAAFHVSKIGQQDVTPVSSPRDREGRRLVPAHTNRLER